MRNQNKRTSRYAHRTPKRSLIAPPSEGSVGPSRDQSGVVVFPRSLGGISTLLLAASSSCTRVENITGITHRSRGHFQDFLRRRDKVFSLFVPCLRRGEVYSREIRQGNSYARLSACPWPCFEQAHFRIPTPTHKTTTRTTTTESLARHHTAISLGLIGKEIPTRISGRAGREDLRRQPPISVSSPAVLTPACTHRAVLRLFSISVTTRPQQNSRWGSVGQ